MSGAERVYGLTGGIGAGKSEAATRFQMLGASLIDADVLARAALDIDGVCYDAVVDAFGPSILLDGGAVDRRKLAKIVFADAGKRDILNGIVHPRVIAEMLRRAEAIVAADRTAIVVLDVPLLFECGMHKSVSASLLVCADEKLRVERVVARDGCAPADASARIRAQMPQEEKMRIANYLIDNNGPIEALRGQVDALYQIFRSEQY